MDQYVIKDDKKLRYGYTTGSCAAGAAKAAARMLVSGEEVHHVRLMTPKGFELLLEIEEVTRTADAVSCAVRKDSGDDPDVTNGTLVFAEVRYRDEPGIVIDGGAGVGRVTKPGLDQPVGNAAINSTPRRMIAEAVAEAAGMTAPDRDEAAGSDSARITADGRGLSVTISIPEGEELAKKTFNPKLGIVGGISVLGTTGIVEPMSDDALKATIEVEIRVRKEEDFPILPVAPGNYGQSFMMETYGFPLEVSVASSNFIAETIEMAAAAGFKRLLFVGHIGKLVKVAGGVRNTHSRYGDRRMEIMTAIAEDHKAALAARPDDLMAEIAQRLADCVSTDEAIRILKEYPTGGQTTLSGLVMADMTERVRAQMEEWAGHRIAAEVVMFSNVYGELGRTEGAGAYMEELTAWLKENKYTDDCAEP